MFLIYLEDVPRSYRRQNILCYNGFELIFDDNNKLASDFATRVKMGFSIRACRGKCIERTIPADMPKNKMIC